MPVQQYSVRPIHDGFAVFDGSGSKVSEVFGKRDDAIAEARAYLGGEGILLVEDESGHVVDEHV